MQVKQLGNQLGELAEAEADAKAKAKQAKRESCAPPQGPTRR